MVRSATLWVRGYRLFFSILAFVALAAQWKQGSDAGVSTTDFFSYFTIDSNIIAVVGLLWAVWKPHATLKQDIFRGAGVLYLAVTGIVFALLLSGLPLVTVPFSNTVLHKLMPVVIVVDWLSNPPVRKLPLRQAAIVWMIFPVFWLAYTLWRGVRIGWYPYPFLNPETMGGMGNVLGMIAAILVGAFFLIWLIVFLGNKARRQTGSQ